MFLDLARHGAAFAVVMLNDGWFLRPEALALHAQNGGFRAVESGLPVLRAANTGRTVAFDAYGRRIKAVYPPDQLPGFALVDVPVSRGLTPYAQSGDIFVWLCAGFVIIMVLRPVRKFLLGKEKIK